MQFFSSFLDYFKKNLFVLCLSLVINGPFYMNSLEGVNEQ